MATRMLPKNAGHSPKMDNRLLTLEMGLVYFDAAMRFLEESLGAPKGLRRFQKTNSDVVVPNLVLQTLP